MRAHPAALNDGRMDPALYMIRINGHLGTMLLSAFPATVKQQHGPVTVVTGVLDQPALYGVLAEIETLGLDLLEVREARRAIPAPQERRLHGRTDKAFGVPVVHSTVNVASGRESRRPPARRFA